MKPLRHVSNAGLLVAFASILCDNNMDANVKNLQINEYVSEILRRMECKK